jgi:hypothetical protein
MDKPEKIPPYLLVRLIGSARNFLQRLKDILFPGPVVLYEQFQYFWLLQPLYVAASLDIAGLLKKRNMTSAELAEKTGTHPESLYRVLRALSSNGIFTEKKDGTFGLNSRAKALLDGSGSMRHVIMHHLSPVNWSANGNLLETVRTGRNSFRQVHGLEVYDFLQEHPAELATFEASMSELSSLSVGPVLSRFDFSAYPLIADIGGGDGFLLAQVLNRYPGSKGIVLDLPENREKAEKRISESGLSGRLQFVGGSFREPLNLRADLIIMKNVLHNWDDKDAESILENVARCMENKTRLLVMEMVVPDPGKFSYAKMVDVQMLATMPGGKERTLAGFEKILASAGLRILRYIPTIAPLSVLEAGR